LRSSVWAVVAVIALVAGLAIGLSSGPARTVTQTITATATQTVTVTRLSMGAVLVTNNGTGKASSQPFTATTANVEVNLNMTATTSLNYTGLYWAIYPVGGSVAVCYGSINQQQGSFTDYCYGLTTGADYYIQVNAAGVDWRMAVTELH
jgi:hypothetical protein